MKDFKTILTETKSQLNGMLSKESTKEQIELVANINKQLDGLQEVFTEKVQENESLKETIINQVKNTGFAPNGNQHDDSGVDQNQKSMDEIMEEELSKIIAKQK